MDLSIIIISYNTKNILFKCMEAVITSPLKMSYEIIVVDNASTDGTPEKLKKNFPKVKLIVNPNNKMFAKANNQAMKIAKGDCFLLLNSDCFVKNDTIETIYGFLNSANDIACVGPRLLNEDGSFQFETKCFDNFHYFFSVLFGVKYWVVSKKLKSWLLPNGYPGYKLGEIRKAGWVSGACLMIKRKVFDKIGGLDENFYFYREEVEWCYRMKNNSFQVWSYPIAEAVHLCGKSVTKEISDKSLLHKKQNLDIYYYKKTIGLFHGLTFDFCWMLLFILILTVAIIIGNTEKKKYALYVIKYKYQVLSNFLTKNFRKR
jgi:GT2 family glycosyltransferase